MEKLLKRLTAVALSLMLMFTMGVNVFAAEGVEGTPNDDPAVTLDEGDAAAVEAEPVAEEPAAAVDEEEPAAEAPAKGAVKDATEAPVVDNTTTLPDGEYGPDDFTFTATKASDGSAVTNFTLQKITVTDGKATGTIKVDKATKTHIYVGHTASTADDPTLVDPDTGACGPGVYAVDVNDPDSNWVAEVPVALNEDAPFAVRMYMSANWRWVNYNYHIQIEEPLLPTENQEKFAGIEYSSGMLSAASIGTSLTVNPDATITVHVTTKPMISNKYTKVAFSTDTITTENVESIAEAFPVTVSNAMDTYVNRDGVEVGERMYYWSEFEYTVPVSMVGKEVNAWAYNTLKSVQGQESTYVEVTGSWARKTTWIILDTPELYGQIQTAYNEATDEDIKAAFNAVLSHSFNNEAVTVGAIPAQTYTGQAITPAVVVKSGETALEEGTDYEVTFENNMNAGTATAIVAGKGDYTGEKTAEFTINKAKNPLTVSAKTATLKKKALKKKAQKLAISKVMTVKKAQGTVTYNGVGVNKKSKKALKINAKNGQITVKKKTKKGTYKMKITVKAAGNSNYNALSVTKTVTIKVK